MPWAEYRTAPAFLTTCGAGLIIPISYKLVLPKCYKNKSTKSFSKTCSKTRTYLVI